MFSEPTPAPRKTETASPTRPTSAAAPFRPAPVRPPSAQETARPYGQPVQRHEVSGAAGYFRFDGDQLVESRVGPNVLGADAEAPHVPDAADLVAQARQNIDAVYADDEAHTSPDVVVHGDNITIHVQGVNRPY